MGNARFSGTASPVCFARTTARTAERRAWSLRREEDVHEIDIRFLNRMSDYIFLLMRLEEQDVRDK